MLACWLVGKMTLRRVQKFLAFTLLSYNNVLGVNIKELFSTFALSFL